VVLLLLLQLGSHQFRDPLLHSSCATCPVLLLLLLLQWVLCHGAAPLEHSCCASSQRACHLTLLLQLCAGSLQHGRLLHSCCARTPRPYPLAMLLLLLLLLLYCGRPGMI
jgi:hypothetical protein